MNVVDDEQAATLLEAVGGTDTGADIFSLASQIVLAGGVAISAHLGETDVSSPSTYGGRQFVSSGGVASGSFLGVQGHEIVSAGGTAIDTTVAGTLSKLDVYGSATGTVINPGGREFLYGTDTGASITGSGGFPGATFGGTQYVESGGTSIDAVVNGGFQQVLSGGVASNTTVTGDGYQLVYSGGVDAGLTISSGRVDFSSGDTISAGGLSLVATSGTTISGGFQVSGNGNELDIGAGVGALSDFVVSSFDVGDAIDLKTVNYDSAGHANLLAGNILEITGSGGTYDFHLDPTQDFSGKYFHLLDDGSGHTLIEEDTTPCYCPGTLILTDRGEMPVEQLAIGDNVVTMSGAVRPIKWIGRRSYAGRFTLGQKHLLPVCIEAGAIEAGVPRRDLWISPHHAMYLNGVLIEARHLVNGVNIFQAERVDEVSYIHVELETHDVLIAEGSLSESFTDDDSRMMFHNAREYSELYPDTRRAPALYCAPRVEDGFELETARRQIDAGAGLRSMAGQSAQSLRGHVDAVVCGQIEGWAQCSDHPEAAVCLDIVVDGEIIGQTLANRYREDLQAAGVGSGCHAFTFKLGDRRMIDPGRVEVRRSLDGFRLDATGVRVSGLSAEKPKNRRANARRA